MCRQSPFINDEFESKRKKRKRGGTTENEVKPPVGKRMTWVVQRE